MAKEGEQFNCTGCGLCCYIPLAVGVPREWDRGDGYCKHLQDDMSCGIYENRPLACRVDDSWDKEAEKIQAVLGVKTREEYHDLLYRGCQTLQEIREQQLRDRRLGPGPETTKGSPPGHQIQDREVY